MTAHQYGLTSTGFVRKSHTEILADVETWQRDKISEKLDLSERTALGNINVAHADQLSLAWEALEAAAGALDPDNAVEALLIGLCKLTGVTRGGATQGHAQNVTLTFSKATTIPAGTLLLAVTGEDTNLWHNDSDVVVTAAGTAAANFTSVAAGSAATAPYGTLTQIKIPIDGLTSATNSTDALPGTDVQSLDSLRAAREASLAATGKGTPAAIAAELIAAGAVDCRVNENDTSVPVGGLPAHSVQVVEYAPGLTDAQVAAAIYRSKGATTETYGTLNTGVTDPWGRTKYIHHTRAVEILAAVDIQVSGSTTAAAVKAALMAAHTPVIDRDVLHAALLSAAFRVPGVTNVPQLLLSTPPYSGWTSGDLSVNDLSVGLLDPSRITVAIV